MPQSFSETQIYESMLQVVSYKIGAEVHAFLALVESKKLLDLEK